MIILHFFSGQKLLRGMQPQGTIPPDRELLRNAMQVAWPSIVESFLVAMVSMIDTMMVSTLGEAAIAAVGLTVQPKFIGFAVFISLNTAVSALVARRKGQQDRDSANKVMVQSIIITLILVAIISTVAVVFADPIIRFAGSAADTHEDAKGYFQIIMGGMVFQILSMVINAAQRGVGNTKISMRTNVISNLINIIFNYLLIGGNLGFPALGVRGAAIATVIGTVAACIMSFASVMHKSHFLCLWSVKRISFDKPTLKAIANIGSSTLAEQIFLRIGFLIYAMLIARLGTTAFAAHQIGTNMLSLSFSFGDGLSVAAVTLVGQNLGAKRQDLAKIYGGVCQRIGLIFAAMLSIVFLTLGRPIYSLFSDDPTILDYGVKIMAIMTVVVFMQISQVIFTGCLRGAGDAKYTAFVSLVSVAIVRPLMGWLFCYPLGWGLIGAWIGLVIDQSVRLIMSFARFKKGKWMYLKI